MLTKNFSCYPKSSGRPWEGWAGRIASRFSSVAPPLGCSVCGCRTGGGLARRPAGAQWGDEGSLQRVGGGDGESG